MAPVGLQRVCRAAKHDADIVRVLATRVEVCVVANVGRQTHGDLAHGAQRRVKQLGAREQLVAADAQQLRQARAGGLPYGA